MIPKVLSRDDLVAWATVASLRMPIRPQRILDVFGGPIPLFQNPPSDLLDQLEWTPNQRQKLRDARLEPMAQALLRLEGRDIQVLGYDDERYPERLRQISCPPAALWVRGNPLALSRPLLAVVGSRQASDYGISVTMGLSKALVAAGLGVVSGGAVGIDAAAHETTLRADGCSVAVLGTGIDVDYPSVHRSLYERLAQTGACVTEFAPGMPPRPEHFPIRNRLISGLSLGVVVVEAGEKSGGLITARFALEQNREVFAIPGPVNNPGSVGPHRLIQQGARLVTNVEDILGELRLGLGSPLPAGEGSPRVSKSSGARSAATAGKADKRGTSRNASTKAGTQTSFLDMPSHKPGGPTPELPEHLKIYAKEAEWLLSRLSSGAMGLSQLVEEAPEQSAVLAELLLELELEGVVQQLPGQRYALQPTSSQ